MALVEVLLCPNCAAPVPIGDDDPARCVHCDAQVPLPDVYRELRAAARLDDTARRDAERLLRRLDRPPLLVTKLLAAIFDQPMILFWLFYGVPLGLVSILGSIAIVGENGSFPAAVALIFGIIFAFTFAPRALGVYAHRRASARALLVNGLRARPPRRPREAAACRVCAAPLAMPEDALVVRCLYCGADNATRVRTGAPARAVAVARTVDEAAARDRTERGATRRELGRELIRYLLTTAVFAGLVELWALYQDSGYGVIALVVLTLLLIALFIRSLARAGDRAAERRQRRAGNDVPEWVGVVGPIGLWVLLYLVLRLR